VFKEIPRETAEKQNESQRIAPELPLFREDQRVHNPSDDPVREAAGTITTGKEQAL
jgi:hypothetical protein